MVHIRLGLNDRTVKSQGTHVLANSLISVCMTSSLLACLYQWNSFNPGSFILGQLRYSTAVIALAVKTKAFRLAKVTENCVMTLRRVEKVECTITMINLLWNEREQCNHWRSVFLTSHKVGVGLYAKKIGMFLIDILYNRSRSTWPSLK